MRKATLLLVAATLAIGLAGVAAADVEPHVEANPQVTDDANVTVAEANIDGDGYLVIHEDPEGENYTSDTVLGVTDLEEGEHEDVTVELDEELEERQLLWAVLYFADDEFEFDDASVLEIQDDDGEWHDVEDDFYVVVGDPDHERVGESYQTLAENLQQRSDFQRQLDGLRSRLDELEDSDDPDVEDEKEDVRSEIDEIETSLEGLDSQIENTTRLIDEILEAEQDGDDDEEDDGEDDEDQGLPGFTAVAAMLSLIAVALYARRHD